MLIQYVKEHSTVRPLFFGTAVQTANFIQMKGAVVCRLCFRRLFVVRSLRSLLFVRVRCKGCAFCLRSLLLFARGCACVRFRAVFGCLFAVCAAFSAFAILCPPCALSRVLWLVLQPRLQPLLCSLRSEIQRLGGAKIGGGTAGGQAPPPASVGAFYRVRSPSASRCNFSAIR